MSPEERDARIRAILPRALAREAAERERKTPTERSSAGVPRANLTASTSIVRAPRRRHRGRNRA